MKNYLLIPFLLLLSAGVSGQDSVAIRSVTSSTMLGIGSSDVLDTYLTPLDYSGFHLSLLNERMQVARFGAGKWVNQQKIWVEYSSNDNSAQNGLVATGFLGYSWGTNWKQKLAPGLVVMAGPYVAAETGFIYNLRNGNNPASAKLSVETGAAVMGVYQLNLFPKFPITLRYQASMPVMSVFFSPHYEQSYYEIFSLGNTDGIVRFGSFHNRFDMNNYFTVDLPVGAMNLRIGFLNKIHNTHVNDIKTRRISNSFLIGFSKEFLPFSRKKPSVNATRINNALF
ncbi:MAG: DUF3316 domain-containing protein [Bacteroidales bacterium]